MTRRRLVTALALTLPLVTSGCLTALVTELWDELRPRCPEEYVVECAAGTLELQRTGTAVLWEHEGQRLVGRELPSNDPETHALVEEARRAGLPPRKYHRAVRCGARAALVPCGRCPRHGDPYPRPLVAYVRDDPWPAADAGPPSGWTAHEAQVDALAQHGNAWRCVGRGFVALLYVPAVALDVINVPGWLLLAHVASGGRL